MNIQHLETFCAVIQEGSMTAAAQRMFLTQPAVSQQIQSLEEELSAELLVRGARTVKPTSQGLVLYEYARRILNLVDQAKIGIQTAGVEVSGPLRVATVNSIGLHMIGPVFALFLRNNKKVSIRLQYIQGSAAIALLDSGQVDVAVLPDAKREFGTEPKDCDKQFIFEDEIWLLASGNDSTLPESIELSQLLDKPFVSLHNEYPGFENYLTKELKRQGKTISPIFESSNVGTLKRVIESGLGWGFLPSHSVAKQVQSGRLKRVKIRGLDYKYSVYCYRPLSRDTAASDLFVKAVKNQPSV